MILALRSLLWHHGAITGTCDTSQANQTDDALGSTPVSSTAGGAIPARRRRREPVFLPLLEIERPAAISGSASTIQPSAVDSLRAQLGFGGTLDSFQLLQRTRAVGDMFDAELAQVLELLMEVA